MPPGPSMRETHSMASRRSRHPGLGLPEECRAPPARVRQRRGPNVVVDERAEDVVKVGVRLVGPHEITDRSDG